MRVARNDQASTGFRCAFQYHVVIRIRRDRPDSPPGLHQDERIVKFFDKAECLFG